jgi:signal transduction histidine kinase
MVRGESLVATAGLIAAAILVLALGAAAWWSVHTYGQAVETARHARARAVAQLLARNAAAMIASDNLTGVQRLVDEASRANGFAACRVVVPSLNGQVIADADTAAGGVVESLPEKWTTAGAPAEAQESASVGADGSLQIRTPIAVPGRGQAELQVNDESHAASVDAWPMQAGIGLIGTGAMAALWLTYRAMRRRLRALGAIGEALKSPNLAESAQGELIVNPDLGPEAAAWNRLISDRERLRDWVAGGRAAEKLSSRRNRDGELGSVCDGLWLGLLLVDDQLKVKYVNGAASVFLRSKREDLHGADLKKTIDDQKVLDAIRGVAAGAIRNRVVSEIRREGDAIGIDAGAVGHEVGGGVGGGAGGSVLRITVRPLRKEDAAIALVVIEDVTQQRVADEARNSFVAQATHELRTPLTNIRLYLEMLVEGGGAEDAKKRSDGLNVINQEVRRLERIVGDMLSVSEIEAGSLKLNNDDVRINTVFDELAGDFREQATSKEIKLRFDLPPKMPVLRGDRDKIVMALHNLIGNAIKYTPAGGEVTVRVSEEKGQLAIDVTDNGIGVRDEERELIFEKFYRAKDRRITNITGTGLGLAIAREVVRMHGGDITVRSQLDKGSTFTMTLPAAA